MKKVVFFLVFVLFLGGLAVTEKTRSSFGDQEKKEGNILSVATSWGEVSPTPSLELTPTPIPTLIPTPTPTLVPIANHLVINEVYYDVASNKGNESQNEWVEIYNPTSTSFDISGWKICDNIGCETIPSSSVISAGGYAVITPQATTWDYWSSVPSGAVKIVLGTSNIGSGLHNDNDRVILKDSQGKIVDQVSYGNDETAFNPPCLDIAEGHSLERSPAGKDTDTAADFIDQSNPTPGSGIP